MSRFHDDGPDADRTEAFDKAAAHSPVDDRWEVSVSDEIQIIRMPMNPKVLGILMPAGHVTEGHALSRQILPSYDENDLAFNLLQLQQKIDRGQEDINHYPFVDSKIAFRAQRYEVPPAPS